MEALVLNKEEYIHTWNEDEGFLFLRGGKELCVLLPDLSEKKSLFWRMYHPTRCGTIKHKLSLVTYLLSCPFLRLLEALACEAAGTLP